MSEQVSRASLSAVAAESMQRNDSVRTSRANGLDESLLIMSSVVELNLRLPSMLHGKKGFERIVWAFANVLTQSMAWLFQDLQSNSGLDEGDHAPEAKKKKKETVGITC